MHAHESANRETTDIDIRGVLGFGLGLFVAAIAIHLIVWGLFLYLAGQAQSPSGTPSALARGQQNRLPPEPRLQTNPREDLRELRAGEDRLLTTYGWVDKNTETVRIPIAAAMKLAVERGLPARPESEPKR